MNDCWSCQTPISSGEFCRACGARTRWRSWQITKEVGEGGNGTAYLVEQTGRTAVLKIPQVGISKAQHQRECRNLYLAATFGVAPAPLETVSDGLHLGMVMEYLPTPTQMPARERARLFLGALNRLHNQELVHCDLKPENIIGYQLIDLGSMIDLVRDEVKSVYGTPGYAPPEAYRREVSPKLDAYAAGWVIVSWLGGPDPSYPPHYGYPQTWVPPSDPSVDWENLLRGLLEPDPTKRLSAGKAYSHLSGAWCQLQGGHQIGSDLVTVQEWQQVCPSAHCRENFSYATELADTDIAQYLQATSTRLPTLAELHELALGTQRQMALRSHERQLAEGRISNVGARNASRFLWQPTKEGVLWGGTTYSEALGPVQPFPPNAMIGLRVVRC